MEIKKIVSVASKKHVLILVAVLLGVFLTLALFGNSRHKDVYSKNIDIEARFCDGSDWNRMNSLNITELERGKLKGELLQVVIESSALSGNPLLNSTGSLPEYMTYLDKFYQIAENQPFPIFFALKMVDMAKGGVSNSAINTYQVAVSQKLKEYGLLK